MREHVVDESDRATEQEMMANAIALATIRNRKMIEATGACLNCREPVASGLRWCDTDCRDDWEKRDRYY